MFCNITSRLKSESNQFKENINDSFGNSIIVELYEPFILEVIALETVEENLTIRLVEIDSIIEKAKLIS